jgi:uncharacterized protein YhfF
MVCGVETVAVRVVALQDVPLEHAIAEGEGYETVDAWRASHEAFWGSPQMRAELGPAFVIDGSTRVVLERFATFPLSNCR